MDRYLQQYIYINETKLCFVGGPFGPLKQLHGRHSLIRNRFLLGPYSSPVPRALWWSLGGGCFLCARYPCRGWGVLPGGTHVEFRGACSSKSSRVSLKPFNTTPSHSLFLSLFFLLLSSLELSDSKVYEPFIRALLGTASQFCEVVEPFNPPPRHSLKSADPY